MNQSAAPGKTKQAVNPASPNGTHPNDESASEPFTTLPNGATQPGVMASMPRRQPLANKIGDTPPPQMKFISFKPGRWQAFRRLFTWFLLIAKFLAGNFGDKLRGRDSIERRAKRLRRAFEAADGTFSKIGQHLAMRLDFLPWTYCIELSRMRDEVPPIATDEAIAIIERGLKQPLSAAFQAFDPEPVISDAVACTYQAITLDGKKVVVKVRRPGVGELFMSDALVFDWLTKAIEFMTVVRPGYMDDLRREFKETLLSELDFVQEARSQDFFRRSAKKSGKKFFTSPRINFDLSSPEVIVEEFISGIWLWEILAAIEQNDQHVLGLMEQLAIDPVILAKRLNWVSSWSWEENMFFLSNPHPDNIIVGPKSKLIFTDFSQISSIEGTKRYALSQNLYYTWKEDALNMARASMVLLEPLPPLDIAEFTKELESHNWHLLYMIASSNVGKSWAERTAALQWIGLIKTAAKYRINIDFSVLRLIRSILLSDTLSARLDPEFDLIKAYRRYNHYRAQQARREVTDKLSDLEDAADEKIYLRLERLATTTQGLHFRLRHALTIPKATFSILLSKWSAVILSFFKFLVQGIGLLVLFIIFEGAQSIVDIGSLPALVDLIREASQNRVFLLLLAIVFFVNSRVALFRIEDKES